MPSRFLQDVAVVRGEWCQLSGNLESRIADTLFDLLGSSANAPDAPSPETRKQKVRHASLDVVGKTLVTRVELEICDSAFGQEYADHVQVSFDHRQIRNMLEDEQRVEKINLPRVITRPMEQIFRARDGAKTGVANAIVIRETPSAPNHGLCDINAHHFPKISGERKEQAPNAAPKLHRDARTNPIFCEQRQQLPLHRSLTALPEFARVIGFQTGEYVGVRVILGKSLP